MSCLGSPKVSEAEPRRDYRFPELQAGAITKPFASGEVYFISEGNKP